MTARGVFHKPDVGYAMKELRRKLMKPVEGIVPLYVAETRGVSIDEVFMRGVHRTRPANQQGEELRDVIIWLWVLEYSSSVGDQIAFVSKDSGFWTKDGIHPDIARDPRVKDGRVSIYSSIDNFAKQHAPAPAAATSEWLREHFQIQAVESQLIDQASKALRLEGRVKDLALESHEFVDGSVYDVGPKTQFAELRFKLMFKFTYSEGTARNFIGSGLGFSSPLIGRPTFADNYISNISRFLSAKDLQPDDAGFLNYSAVDTVESPIRELHCDAETKISVRVKDAESSEVSVDSFKLDRWKLQMDLYGSKTK